MKARIVFCLLLCPFIVVTGGTPPSARPPDAAPATLVLTGGRVWTGNAKQRWAEAIAIRGETIVAVGRDADIRALVGPDTRRMELNGRFVMPGINDAHIHFGGTTRLTQVDLNDARSLEQMQQRVAAHAREHPEAAWIQGFGWQYAAIPDGLPHRAQLDAVVPDRPAALASYDGHTVWVNSKALEIAGVTRATRFEGYGEIVRDASGEPTGVLKEGAMALVRRHIPEPTHEERRAALRRGLAWIASLGITSLQNAGGRPAEIELYRELLESGELTARVSFAISVSPETTEEEIRQIRALADQYRGPRLRVGAVKIVLDGVIETHTAAMLAPYADAPETSGRPSYTSEQLRRAVALADRAGLQVYIHAIGDRAVRMALDAFEHVRQQNGGRDSRFRIEHIETIAPSDIPRFARLGVLAVMMPIHADPGTVVVWSKAVGTERTRRAFPWRQLERAGARLVFASDWPAAISIDPRRGLQVAVSRQTPEGKPAGGWVPWQRVSLESALRAYTAAGAFASSEEGIKGTLEPGKLADLVVLGADPFRLAAADLPQCRVEATIIGGQVIYTRGAPQGARR